MSKLFPLHSACCKGTQLDAPACSPQKQFVSTMSEAGKQSELPCWPTRKRSTAAKPRKEFVRLLIRETPAETALPCSSAPWTAHASSQNAPESDQAPSTQRAGYLVETTNVVQQGAKKVLPYLLPVPQQSASC